jgi:predicted enzyme related to lactoylglutathione lyase
LTLLFRREYRFNFIVSDIEEAYKYIHSKDIEIVKEIEEIGEFPYFNFKDPDGNVLMICNC